MAFGFFKKKKKDATNDERYQILTIRAVIDVAKDAVNVVFEKPEADFQYKPGQFLTIIKEINGKKIRRAYSLCTTPFEDEYPAVTVKRVPGGMMSNHINDEFKAGDQVEVMNPMGMFITEFDAEAERQVVFLGGGSGITPLYSLLRSILIKEPKSKVALVYGNRSEEYIVFKKELADLKEKYGQRFELVHILEEDAHGLAKVTGRPSVGIMSDVVKAFNVTSETEFFICGPEPMMDIAFDGLKVLNIVDDKIRKESFDAGKTSPSVVVEEAPSGAGTSDVTVLLYGEEYVFKAKKSESILDAGLNQSIDMPYSCQSGLCTACRAKCIEGKVSLDDAHGVSQAEIDEGYVLLCVGKPLTDKVKVEVG